MYTYRSWVLSGLIFSMLLIFTAVGLVLQRTSWTGRATGSSITLYSRENSYLFASPISATANGTSVVRVTVFILDGRGLGVSNLPVEIETDGVMTIEKTQDVTDAFGRALFDATSITPGVYTLRAVVAGVSLPQTVSVAFR